MNNWLKRNGIHLLIALIFIVIAAAYFTPAFQGKTLGQVDVIGAQSTQKEINDYRAKDTTILWTNQIFGGMPAFQIWAPYPKNMTTGIVDVLTSALPDPLYIVFLLLFGSYFLFSVLKLNPWIAAGGAVAFTFSSYNIILVAAGHTNQVFAIAFFAPILASLLLILRQKYWLGSSLLALFLALEIRANHIQMTYYLLIAILILAIIEFVRALKSKTLSVFLKGLGFVGAAIVIAIMVNASLLWSTAEYGEDTIRGPSNLSQHTSQPSNGLSKQYAYEYSQTTGENITFLIPDAYGGQTGLSDLDPENSATVKAFQDAQPNQQQAQAIERELSTYWGDKPLTSGPHYMGAVICFLFVLGLLIVRNPLKWWLLATVILTSLLSIGSGFTFFSDLFFNYFPLYNKFRATESILAVTGLCVPILALMAAGEVTANTDKAYLLKKLKIAFYVVGGILLVFLAAPGIFLSFRQSNQLQLTNYIAQVLNGNAQAASNIMRGIESDRESLERWDAFSSLIFVTLSFGLIWLFIKQKINTLFVSIGLFALILIDLWRVDKRYLNDAVFQDKQDAGVAVQPRAIDTLINKTADPDYRVFDATQDIKRDRYNPFFHKNIGGYSAARLKRFDELIDNQIAVNPPNRDVLDMLNTRYIIVPDSGNNYRVIQNQTACGHAWFVKKVSFVANADKEMDAIKAFSPKDEAIVDQRYKKDIDTKLLISNDPNAKIDLVKYNPDDMVYQSGSTSNQVAVFSEIYYNKGWKMYIDGVESPYFRADYVLRAAQIPAGNHKIEFKFHPASYYTGENISLAGSVIMILALGGAAYAEVKRKKTESAPAPKKK